MTHPACRLRIHELSVGAEHMNIDKYLQRINFDQSLAPTLETLRGIVLCHVTSIAFENLNPLLGMPVSLELADVERKLVDDGRGGYCFEQNLLLSEALRVIGFQVTALAARVLWMQPDDTTKMRSHMLLRVDLDDRIYLVDVAFGGQTLTGALELVADVEQPTPHEVFRLIRQSAEPGSDWRMQARLRGGWHTLCSFDLQPQHAIDYHAVNYFVSTHPTSYFVHNLVAARPTRDGRYTLSNREFSFRSINGEEQRCTLHDTAEIRAVLQDNFNIALPDTAQLDKRLAQLP